LELKKKRKEFVANNIGLKVADIGCSKNATIFYIFTIKIWEHSMNQEQGEAKPTGQPIKATWGWKFFVGVLLAVLTFFWWLLIYSGGAVVHHG